MKFGACITAVWVGIACLLPVVAAAEQYDCYFNATEDVFVAVFQTREGDVKGEVIKKAFIKSGERVYHQSSNPIVFIGYTTEHYDDEVNRMANLRQVQLRCADGAEIDIP